MEPLVEKLLIGFKMIEAMLLEKAEDGLSDAELDQLDGELGVFVSAVEMERELRQAAYEDARSLSADKNKAEKI